MSKSYGTGVSRTLEAFDRAFRNVVFQKGKPPLDAEFNLQDDIHNEVVRQVITSHVNSGFLLDPTNSSEDFQFNALWSNLFLFGNNGDSTDETQPFIFANVNGWIVPVAGTNVTVDGDMSNFVRLHPPPGSDTRTDLVFLEVWQASVAPNPSTDNKPSASTIWKFGNVEYGGTNVADDIEDSTIGFETTERVQVQYRLRVHGSGEGAGASVDLANYPDGLGDPTVLGQGTASSPVGGLPFTNMRADLGDAGLWRAGDGNPNNSLGTVDGYVYAIPLCAVFRRNSSAYSSIATGGNPNHNGAFNRNPSASALSDPRTGAKVLLSATLTSDLNATATGVINITNLTGSGIDEPFASLSNVFLVLDADSQYPEVVGVNAVDTGAGTITIPANGRGRWGTDARPHLAGTTVTLFNTHPDGVYSDQITEVLDLRRGVSLGDWDYEQILLHNLTNLTRGDLKTIWKKSYYGDTQGPSVIDVTYLDSSGAIPNQAEGADMDGPDGVRWIWSDAATVQSDVTLLLQNVTPTSGVVTSFNSSSNWDIAPDFQPDGWLNNPGANPDRFSNGAVIFLHIGGDDGESGARGTFRSSGTRAVRFVAPYEMDFAEDIVEPPNGNLKGNKRPWTMRFQNDRTFNPPAGTETAAAHPGPFYPEATNNWEKPFLVLGGVVHSDFLNQGSCTVVNNSPTTGDFEVDIPGLNFDSSAWWDDGSTDTSFLSAVAINAAGTGYAPGDLVTVDGGTFTCPMVLEVLTAGGGGAVTSLRIVQGGVYTSTPGAVGAATTIRTGSGNDDLTVDLTFDTGQHTSDPDSVTNPVLGAGRRTLYDMLTNGGRDKSGNSSELYLVLTGDEDEADNNGAFRIIGAGTAAAGGGYTNQLASAADRVRVRFISQGVSAFVTGSAQNGTLVADIRSQHMNAEDGEGATANDAAACVVITDIQGAATTSWVGLGLPAAQDTNMVLGCSLLYHPGRAGLARIPDEIIRASGVALGGDFLRQSKASIDTTFAAASGTPSNETFYKTAQLSTWNRLPSLGLHAPDAPDYGGNIVASSEQDRETELFVDNGSKTVVWRPFMNRQLTLNSHTISAGTLVPATFNGVTTNFNTIWETTATLGFEVPREVMPRFGRLDIPYHTDVASPLGSGTFLEGINFLFTDSSTTTDEAFGIIGGENNSGTPGVSKVYGSTNITGATYGDYQNIISTAQPAIGCRKMSSTAVYSSDVGRVLRGIELPPYVGIARLYAVYEWADFRDNGSAWEADRITPRAGATNLLRTDGDKQTLFIREGGASDITSNADDHTFVVTENSLDLSKIPTYDASNPALRDFADFEYVVEFMVFGFSRGWINKNNYVRARNYHGDGTQQLAAADIELNPINMTIPAPAPFDTEVLFVSKRTPYQGDPFFTRGGAASAVTTDYQRRYGEVSVADAFMLATPIEQFDSDGAINVETPYDKPLEILASLDFYTTLGTGNIGGEMKAGTVLDVGYTEGNAQTSTRIPAASTSPAARIVPRAFTEGQGILNNNRASVTIVITDNNTIDDATVKFTYAGTTITIVEGGGTWAKGGGEVATAQDLAAAINDTSVLNAFVRAFVADNIHDAGAVRVEATAAGAVGNSIFVELIPGDPTSTSQPFHLYTPQLTNPTIGLPTQSFLVGGEDININAGSGDTRVDLTGMTERLPLGILLQDHDFLSENPLVSTSSTMITNPAGVRPTTLSLPLTRNSGEEYTRLLGGPGEVISLSEGAIHLYEAFDAVGAPTGTKSFRVNRGGTAHVLSQPNPGGPIDWVAGNAIQATDQPILKGGILLCKAMLVRNFKEDAFPDGAPTKTVSEGDEVQMVVLTYGRLGNGNVSAEGVDLSAVISPTGWGEGYAAADRYRIEGRPMIKNRLRSAPELGADDELALYDGTRI